MKKNSGKDYLISYFPLRTAQTLSAAISQLDVLQNLAERADTLDYCRPELSQESGIHVQSGRHPLLNKSCKSLLSPIQSP
ncbi:hypothetical protein P4S72_12205 [Vibrio sp. PP-XX7]